MERNNPQSADPQIKSIEPTQMAYFSPLRISTKFYSDFWDGF